MFDQRCEPVRQTAFAASAALLVLACICTAPALAANSARIDCPEESTRATLNVKVRTLTIDLANHGVSSAAAIDDETGVEVELASSSSILAPRAAAAIRTVFELSHTPPMVGTDAKPETAVDEEVSLPDSGMNTELPGVSEEDYLRYKKQMYRRDI